MQAGNCCLNSARLFLPACKSLSCLLTKRLQEPTAWFCPPVRGDFQSHASMQTNALKVGLHHFHRSLLMVLQWSGIWSVQDAVTVLKARAALSCCTEVAAATLTPRFRGCPLRFHPSHARWLGLGLQLPIPLFSFSLLLTLWNVNLTWKNKPKHCLFLLPFPSSSLVLH